MRKSKGESSIGIDVENEEMGYALQLIESTYTNLFLTGKAGTGKSTLLRHIIQTTRKRCVVLAPTGLAALNVGGQTIHSFFHLPIRPILPDDRELLPLLQKRVKSEEKKLIRELELIIIDEVSMVRADVIDAIDKSLRHFRGRSHLPFGGVQMLFVGDLFQLEPVVPSEEGGILARFYSNPFFFSARAFSMAHLSLVTIELRKVYRQAEQSFVNLLDRIRDGNPMPQDLNILNSRVNGQTDRSTSDMTITLASKRSQVDQINAKLLARLPSTLHSFDGEIEGDFPSSALPTDLRLQLKEGAQVLFVHNDPDRRWVNGSIGIIEQINQEGGSILVRLDTGKSEAVELVRWQHVCYSYNEESKQVEQEILGSFTQYPLKLAWAITVHKSQGLTFDRVIIDFSDGVFAGGQAYVALSRCRSLEGMTLRTPFHHSNAFVRNEVRRFYRTANDRASIDLSLAQADAERGFVQAARLWRTEKYDPAVKAFVDALAKNNIFDNPVYRRLLLHKLFEVERLSNKVNLLSDELAEQTTRLSALSNEQIQMAKMCEEAHEYEAAIRAYDKAIALNPANIQAILAREEAARRIQE